MSGDEAIAEEAGPGPLGVADRRPRLFVSIGTDHHPFDRLLGWVGEWALANPEWDVALQHGRTAPPCHVPNLDAFAFCDHARLIELLGGTDAVVSHGGPATITEARRSGHLPVVVPRDPRHGEHVDRHQMLFASRLEQAGLVTVVGSAAELDAAVRAARVRRAESLASGAAAAAARQAPVIPPGVFRVGRVTEEVVTGAGRAVRVGRVRRR